MKRHGTTAYTLIELVSVAALATILMALAIAGYHNWTRDHAVAAGQTRLLAAISRARAYALAHRVETRCVAVLLRELPGSRADAVVVEYRPTATSAWWCVSQTNLLPDWVAFGIGKGLASNLLFRADGSCRPFDEADDADTTGWLRIQLLHARAEQTADARYHRAVEVNRQTGMAREVLP
ncbi:MAG: hypothetical protein PHR35_19575 [Kiritimatiellae bacterium]|nr:hypothetical protein [Kiritimatiellia bacterium]